MKTRTRLTVLITAISRRVTLLEAFRGALEAGGFRGRVLATDVNPWSPGVHMADAAYAVPLSTAPDYVERVLDVCRREQVDVVVPTIDDELPVFASALSRFAEEGIRVIVSPLETTLACNDKVRTCEILRAAGVSAAASYRRETLPADLDPPLFVKPRVGRGSVSAFQARTRRELEFFLDYVPDPCIQECLDGPEFTLDLFCDLEGHPVSVVPRERVVIRSGVIDRGRTVKNPHLLELGIACARALPFVGPINIQCRMHQGRPVVFEINPRFSGGIGLTLRAGADFAAWSLQLALGRRLAPRIGEFTDNLWMTSHESALYLPAQARFVLANPELPHAVGARP
ncbi:MAG: ATP-grasp domain-containing protein [Vicinamibacterales bacterium]